MADTWTPPIAPSYNSSTSFEPRVLVAKLGDGYEQRTADGLNITPLKGTLNFESLTKTQLDAIVDFMAAKNGIESFFYTFPEEVSARLIICQKWDKVWKTSSAYALQLTVREVFDIV